MLKKWLNRKFLNSKILRDANTRFVLEVLAHSEGTGKIDDILRRFRFEIPLFLATLEKLYRADAITTFTDELHLTDKGSKLYWKSFQRRE